jgi:Fur family transcriptional regulator, zinc uptake regulator
MVSATEILAQRGVQFTALRRWVLTLLCHEPKAIGAYELASAYEQQHGCRVATNSIYRVLEFLERHGLVVHLPGGHTYAARLPRAESQISMFFVCSQCGAAAEQEAAQVEQSVRHAASAIGFVVRPRIIEVDGLCKRCSV